MLPVMGGMLFGWLTFVPAKNAHNFAGRCLRCR
jgi:hypothetical protein